MVLSASLRNVPNATASKTILCRLMKEGWGGVRVQGTMITFHPFLVTNWLTSEPFRDIRDVKSAQLGLKTGWKHIYRHQVDQGHFFKKSFSPMLDPFFQLSMWFGLGLTLSSGAGLFSSQGDPEADTPSSSNPKFRGSNPKNLAP